MCGIFTFISPEYSKHSVDQKYVEKQFMKSKGRGPEDTTFMNINDRIYMGFHRLAINGLDQKSSQPFFIKGVYLICNGEIYNYKELYGKIQVSPETNSDCEVIIHLYKLYGIEYTLNLLDGVFAFVLYDLSTDELITARDPYGVRPMYTLKSFDKYVISSELKQLAGFGDGKNIQQHLPGMYTTYSVRRDTLVEKIYNTFSFYKLRCSRMEDYYNIIYKGLYSAVTKRVIGTTERPVACLLSGGLDSSLITAMVNTFFPQGKLETFSIGMEGSTDLRYARIVADHLKTKHTEIILTEKEFIDAIPEVIYAIESYDTTTVRASVGNYLVSKYISENSEAKVIFNGDGSDELTGGYKYFNSVPNEVEFDRECKRLLSDIYQFDVLRSDRSISSNGLEPRTPFLDRSFVEMYLSIPEEYRCHTVNGEPEKFLLRKSVEFCNEYLLPREVLWRTKEAFSDGVSSVERSWYKVIQEAVENLNIPLMSEKKWNSPTTTEMVYYRSLFDKYYTGCEHLVPYMWMPKYVTATDPSARTI